MGGNTSSRQEVSVARDAGDDESSRSQPLLRGVRGGDKKQGTPRDVMFSQWRQTYQMFTDMAARVGASGTTHSEFLRSTEEEWHTMQQQAPLWGSLETYLLSAVRDYDMMQRNEFLLALYNMRGQLSAQDRQHVRQVMLAPPDIVSAMVCRPLALMLLRHATAWPLQHVLYLTLSFFTEEAFTASGETSYLTLTRFVPEAVQESITRRREGKVPSPEDRQEQGAPSSMSGGASMPSWALAAISPSSPPDAASQIKEVAPPGKEEEQWMDSPTFLMTLEPAAEASRMQPGTAQDAAVAARDQAAVAGMVPEVSEDQQLRLPDFRQQRQQQLITPTSTTLPDMPHDTVTDDESVASSASAAMTPNRSREVALYLMDPPGEMHVEVLQFQAKFMMHMNAWASFYMRRAQDAVPTVMEG